MKPASLKELKEELKLKSSTELVNLCLQLSKYKKENKEYLTYLLYESLDEEGYIKQVKEEVIIQFKEINTDSIFYIKKSCRKILRNIKKHIKYSKKKETEVELLLFYCLTLKSTFPELKDNIVLNGIINRQIVIVRKSMVSFHEDLQYDYELEIKEIFG